MEATLNPPIPVYEFIAPAHGELVWLQYTCSDSIPDFTAYYFDYISPPGELCFRKIITDKKGRRLAFDFSNQARPTEQSHLLIKPVDIACYRLCRSAQEAYRLEMSFFADKITALNASMLQELIPIKPLPTGHIAPIAPEVVAGTGRPDTLGPLSRKATVAIKLVTKINQPANAREYIDNGLTIAKLKRVRGIGPVIIAQIQKRFDELGIVLPK